MREKLGYPPMDEKEMTYVEEDVSNMKKALKMGMFDTSTSIPAVDLKEPEKNSPVFEAAMEEYQKQIALGKTVNQARDAASKVGDPRYNEPKQAPKASEELVEETIEATEIYKRAKELILKAQRGQVAYGLDKYPEPLNADTWSMLETIDHIIDESIDKLHYLVMLRIKLEKESEKETNIFKDLWKKHDGNVSKIMMEYRNQQHFSDEGELTVKVNVTRDDNIDSIVYAVREALLREEATRKQF